MQFDYKGLSLAEVNANSINVTVWRSSISLDKHPSQSSNSLPIPSDNSQTQVSVSSSESTDCPVSTDHIPKSDLAELDNINNDVELNGTPSSIQPPRCDEDRGEEVKEVQIETEDPSHLFWVSISPVTLK